MKRMLLLLAWSLVLSAIFPMLASAQLYDLIVAQDGTGDFTTIQDAVYAIRDYKPEGRQRILVRKGVYEEKLVIPSYKTNITLVGEDRDSTVLVWHDHAGMRDAEGRKIGTFKSYTLLVNGPGFECEDMTIVNDAMTHWNPQWGRNWRGEEPAGGGDRKNTAGVGQAVAVHVEADRTVFRNCRLLGFQDTVFNGNADSRQLFWHCYVEGTVDFLFGPATCWFEECHLHAVSRGYLTAASTPAEHPYGYVFNRCRVTCDPSVERELLGRPWRAAAAVIWKECDLPASIAPVGWDNWRNPENEKTARYYEYKCTGAGASREGRAPWTRELTDTEAARVTIDNVFHRAADTWTSTAWPLSFDSVASLFLPSGRFASRYAAGTLDRVEAADDEPLVVNLAELDCTTFVEYVAAALLARTEPCATDSIYKRFVQALRYRGGRREGYASRKHYFSDWIADNETQGLVREVTADLPGARTQCKPIDFMTAHTSAYPQLTGGAGADSLRALIADRERVLSAAVTCYVPAAKVKALTASDVHAGDIVCFVSSAKGLDIQHVGLITVAADGRVGVLHASSKAGCVVASGSLAECVASLKGCVGIRVVRLR